MRARLALLLALLLPLAGCLGSTEEKPRLAQPTDTPAELPNRPNATEPARPGAANATGGTGRPTLDYDDPGFLVAGGWDVGDTWYYEANNTPYHYRYVEVRARTTLNGREALQVFEAVGPIGRAPDVRLTLWIDAATGARLRGETDVGARMLYTPGDVSHWLYRNATATWNETGRDARGFAWRDHHTLASSFVGTEQVRLPWGTVTAGRVEHRDLVTDADGTTTPASSTRWISAELRYDVQYGNPDRVHILVGARVAGTEVGTIVPP